MALRGKLWDALVEQGPVCHVLGSLLGCVCMRLAIPSFTEQCLVSGRAKNSNNHNQKRFTADAGLPCSPHFPQVFSEISVSKAFLLLLQKMLAKHVKGYEKTLRPRCQIAGQAVEELEGARRVLLPARIRAARHVNL